METAHAARAENLLGDHRRAWGGDPRRGADAPSVSAPGKAQRQRGLLGATTRAAAEARAWLPEEGQAMRSVYSHSILQRHMQWTSTDGSGESVHLSVQFRMTVRQCSSRCLQTLVAQSPSKCRQCALRCWRMLNTVGCHGRQNCVHLACLACNAAPRPQQQGYSSQFSSHSGANTDRSKGCSQHECRTMV